MSDIVVRTLCSEHLRLILYWHGACVAIYDIIVLTSCIVPSCPILVFLHHTLCHVLTSWMCRHDWQYCLHRALFHYIWYYCIYTVLCSVISDIIVFTPCIVPLYLILLYLHPTLFCYIWYYCIYTLHCAVISDIIVFTPCIVPLYLILLYLHPVLFCYIWYYCIYTLHCAVISDIIVFTPLTRHVWHYCTYVMLCCMWRVALSHDITMVWLMWLWWLRRLRRLWWLMRHASSCDVVGITDDNHNYGQYEQLFHWQHIENLYGVMWSSMAEKEKRKFETEISSNYYILFCVCFFCKTHSMHFFRLGVH